MTASEWDEVPFESILADSKDGEWGIGEAAGSHTACWMIRGTDFAGLNDPSIELPLRWIPDHLMNRKRLQPGDVIFEMAGGTATQTTGRSALVRGSFFESHTEHPVLCASFCRHLRLKPEYNSTFLYYLLQAFYRAGYMGVFNIQHTGVSRFQYTAFKKKTVLNIPKEPVQRKIAAVLSAYDELIENNRRRIALLEKLAEELYREWFVRLRFPGHEKLKLVKGVPEGWRLMRFADIVEYYIGGGWGADTQSANFSEGAFVIRGTDIPDIQSGNFDECPFRFHKPSNLKSRELQVDDFIFEVSGGSKDQLLGRNVHITERLLDFLEGPVMAASFCKQLRFKSNEVNPLFMRYFMKLYYECDLVGIYQVQSTGISNYQFESFLKYQTILIPPMGLLTNFAKHVEPIVKLRDEISVANISLRQTRDLLLPRLISGKLPVDHLDIQFPPGMVEEKAAGS